MSKEMEAYNAKRAKAIKDAKDKWNIADLTKEELLERIQYDVHITRKDTATTATYVGWLLVIQVVCIALGILALSELF